MEGSFENSHGECKADNRPSKRWFTQPLLLAILCQVRYEDRTFHEAEALLAENSDLRALGLTHVPDYTTLYRFLRRLVAIEWNGGSVYT